MALIEIDGLDGLPFLEMVIFNSHVKLPEGITEGI